MIENFGDHASNERTFLSWVRTAVAIAGFGFVVEKLPGGPQTTSLSGAILLVLSAILVLLSCIRFLIIRKQIEGQFTSTVDFSRLEILFTGILALLLLAVGLFLFHLI